MRPPRFFVSAGEPSGDLLAAELLNELRVYWPDAEIFGICGPRMRASGAEALFGIEELSVMGFLEVIKHLPFLKHLEFSLLEQIERRQPEIAILVDYPGFHLRLADALRLRGIYVIQYVAPQLWAWGEKRTQTLRAVTDEVLGIMPFETAFFRERQVNFRYVGTPQVDRAREAVADRGRFCLDNAPTIGFFPGSRTSEIRRLLPRMMQIREHLRKTLPHLRFALSMAPSLQPELFASILGEPLGEALVDSPELAVYRQGDTTLVRGQSIHLMKTCDAALVTSGTATLECALTGTPMAVAYVMQPLSFQLAKRFVKLPHISLVNLVADTGLVREFIQDFEPSAVADELSLLAQPGPYRDEKRTRLLELCSRLQGNLAKNAATAIYESWLRLGEKKNASLLAPSPP
jgi:lipid-A-disaccharide synthase